MQLEVLNKFLFPRMKHEEGELKKKQADLKSTEKGYEKDKVAFQAMRKDLSKIEVKNEYYLVCHAKYF